MRLDNVSDFVGSLTKGRSGLLSIPGGQLARFSTVEPWDGQDFVMEDYDDEYYDDEL